jgi:hypothetical protein
MSPNLDQRGGSLQDGRVKKWFWCDNAVFEMGLSKYALVVYLYLCRVAGDKNSCWPSLKTISAATRCGRGIVIKAIKELKAAGLVESKPSFAEDGDRGSNVYTLFNPLGGGAAGDHPVRQENGGGAAGDHGGAAGDHGGAAGDHGGAAGGQEEEIPEEELPKKTTTTPLTPQDLAFEAFYLAYPRKVSKEKARQAWAKIATSPLEIHTIMAAVEAQKVTGNTLAPANGKTYIPHPASWLNGRRWTDEVSAAAAGRESISEKWERQEEGAIAL